MPLPQFNLSPSLGRQDVIENKPDKEELDMTEEMADTMPDMPDLPVHEPLPTSSTAGNASMRKTFGRSATGRLMQSSQRAASSLQRTATRAKSATGSSAFMSQVKANVCESPSELATHSAKPHIGCVPGRLLISSAPLYVLD